MLGYLAVLRLKSLEMLRGVPKSTQSTPLPITPCNFLLGPVDVRSLCTRPSNQEAKGATPSATRLQHIVEAQDIDTISIIIAANKALE